MHFKAISSSESLGTTGSFDVGDAFGLRADFAVAAPGFADVFFSVVMLVLRFDRYWFGDLIVSMDLVVSERRLSILSFPT